MGGGVGGPVNLKQVLAGHLKGTYSFSLSEHSESKFLQHGEGLTEQVHVGV